MDNELLRALRELIDAGRLVATIDVTGKPFYRVTSLTPHTGQPGKLICWLDPQGLDDDLRTPIDDPDADC
jgi:hypothetical protein